MQKSSLIAEISTVAGLTFYWATLYISRRIGAIEYRSIGASGSGNNLGRAQQQIITNNLRS